MDPVTLGMAKVDAAKKARRLPYTAALFGHSVANRNGSGDEIWTGNTTIYNDARGWLHHANMLLGRPFHVIKNAGVGGDTTTQMLARITDITVPTVNGVAVPVPAWLFFEGYINDANVPLTAAQSITNLKSIFTQAFNAGYKRIFAFTELVDNNNSSNRPFLDAVADWLRSYAYETPGFVLVDWREAFLDPSTGGPRQSPGTWTTDSLHPAPLGAAILGEYLADVLTPMVGGFRRMPHTNPANPPLLSVNPMMLVPVSNAAGLLAQGYNQAGLTVAYSLPFYGASDSSLMPRRKGVWQGIASAGVSSVSQSISAGRYTAGSQVYSELEFETDDNWSAVNKFELSLELFGDATITALPNRAVDMIQLGGVTGFGVNPRSGVLRTPFLTVPTTGVLSSSQQVLRLDLTGSLRITRWGTYIRQAA